MKVAKTAKSRWSLIGSEQGLRGSAVRRSCNMKEKEAAVAARASVQMQTFDASENDSGTL